MSNQWTHCLGCTYEKTTLETEYPCNKCYEGDEAVDPEIPRLKATIAKLESDLAEADRRAGAAERNLASAKEDIFRFESSTREYKMDWGVDDLVSFDVVWDEAKALKRQFGESVALGVSSRMQSILKNAVQNIPLAKVTLEWVSRDKDMSPELRSDAVRAIDGLTRIQRTCASMTKELPSA